MIGSKNISDTAMVLAAGFGTRMRPLSEKTPKPLLEVDGRSMLDRALDHLVNVGVKRAVVNGHYLADQIESHIKKRHDIETIFSYEEDILDTGGGVKKARGHFGEKPFLLLGGDLPCLDGHVPTLQQLVDVWDPDKMDELMLLYPTEQAKGFDPTKGDFVLNTDGKILRKDMPMPRPYVWLSAQIVKPFLYDDIDDQAFSNNQIFDRCENAGRLYGTVHQGTCFHVGTPQDLKEANQLLASGQGWG